jgi:ERCC4-type nuclease
MLISPTEPLALRKLGRLSNLPEQYGVDYLYSGMVGVQRKEVKDWVASVRDGRWAKESLQMKSLRIGILLIEGNLKFSSEGQLMIERLSSYSRQEHQGRLLSINLTGIWTYTTSTMEDTSSFVVGMENWLQKETHQSIMQGRPSPPKNDWGTVSSKDWVVWLLTSLPGISTELAGRIYDRYGCPLQWKVDELDLTEVDGIGKVKAKKLIGALDGGVGGRQGEALAADEGRSGA